MESIAEVHPGIEYTYAFPVSTVQPHRGRPHYPKMEKKVSPCKQQIQSEKRKRGNDPSTYIFLTPVYIITLILNPQEWLFPLFILKFLKI